MQYIPIKQVEKDQKILFAVPAIPLKNTKNSIVQKIPHPIGSDTLFYETLEEAKNAVLLAGFSYVLPDGQKGYRTVKSEKMSDINSNYEQIVLNSIADKINSSNSTVAAAAVTAIAEFPNEKTFDILFEKIGEDDDKIRKNAISGICRYGGILADRIIEALQSSNWVVRNSAISVISNLSQDNKIDMENFIIPLSKVCNDVNTIVQANALLTIASVYKQYKKR